MALELKIESLRSRGELTAEERDTLVRLLSEDEPSKTAAQKKGLLTPLRLFLLGVITGVALAYLTWSYLG